jgi:hypothetical protein
VWQTNHACPKIGTPNEVKDSTHEFTEKTRQSSHIAPSRLFASQVFPKIDRDGRAHEQE